MEEIKDLLHDAALSDYEDIFEEMGYDSLEHLLTMEPSDLLDLKRLTKMKEGHFVRFQSTLKSWSASATPSTASAPTTPMSVGPIETGQFETQLVELAPAAMDPAAIGPTGPTMDFRPKTVSSLKASLRKAYKTWKEARLVSLDFSTQLGCSAMMDNKKSGSRRKILRCRTALSKKLSNNNAGEDADAVPKCPHYLLWTCDHSRDWKLNWDQSILEHKDFCNSGQLVTKIQLVHDPEFVKSQKLGKLSTGKEAAKLALGYNGRLSGSVKVHTARRARNTIKHYNAFDYDDDWSKLNQWGHEFMELNPRSIFHLEKDDAGRLVIGCM